MKTLVERQKVLVIQDNPSERERVERILASEGFEVSALAAGKQTISLAKAVNPGLILLEVELQNGSGYQLCRELRNHRELSRIPIVLLSSQKGLDKTESLECGAADYIVMPATPNDLVVRVKMNLRRHQEDRSVSFLTDLPGGSAVEEEIKKRVLDHGRKFAVIFVDMDDFKVFNHAYGFLRGDELIKFVARISASAISRVGEGSDFLGHEGGDDFVLVTVPERAASLGKIIVQDFDRHVPDFYGFDDLRRGFVVAPTRQGAVVKHPIMTISACCVSNEKREISTHWEVREIGRELKEYAKNIPGSGYYPDRRQDDE